MSGMLDLSLWRGEYDYIVFDDISFTVWITSSVGLGYKRSLVLRISICVSKVPGTVGRVLVGPMGISAWIIGRILSGGSTIVCLLI